MKALGRFLIFTGVMFILLAAIWAMHMEREEIRAEEEAATALIELGEAIKAGRASEKEAQSGAEEPLPEDDIPFVIIDGHSYIGYLSIPELSLELPVQLDWSLKKLEKSPCRYAGSLACGNLIIAGHNYRKHFTPLKKLTVGSRVLFTDVEDVQYDYTVSEILAIKGTDTQRMLADEADWNLTLFTCTYGGGSRLTVRCIRQTE